jgi:hypothetical protein
MADIFYETGGVKLRRKITPAELDSVPEPYRLAYGERGHADGDLVLSSRAADYATAALAEIAELNAKIEKLKTEGPAKVEAAKKARRDGQVETALHRALTKASVKPGLVEGAIAMLMEQNEFEVEASETGKGFVVLAKTPYGLNSVEAVVERLIQGEEGAVWLDKRPAPSAGYFNSMLSGMKERR